MYQYAGIPQRTRRGIGGCITGIIILLLIVGGLGFFISRVRNGVTISVGAHPTVVGNNCGGAIFVQAGPENQITFAGIFPQYTQDSSTNTVEITQCNEGLTITVPPETNIQMDANDKITVLGVNGTMQLSTNGSRMTLEQVTLQGQSKIDDNGGTIVFAGSIAQGSTSTISDNSGSIDMTLPASSSFHLDLTGILGPIASNFPGVQSPASETSDVQVNVGSNPSAVKLTLDLNDTDVVLSKAA
jgi:hypothetical protein